MTTACYGSFDDLSAFGLCHSRSRWQVSDRQSSTFVRLAGCQFPPGAMICWKLAFGAPLILLGPAVREDRLHCLKDFLRGDPCAFA